MDISEFGTVSVDLGYGGAFYALVSAQVLGLNLTKSTVQKLVDAATKVKGTISRTDVGISFRFQPKK